VVFSPFSVARRPWGSLSTWGLEFAWAGVWVLLNAILEVPQEPQLPPALLAAHPIPVGDAYRGENGPL
jgi:hypothetical protein